MKNKLEMERKWILKLLPLHYDYVKWEMIEEADIYQIYIHSEQGKIRYRRTRYSDENKVKYEKIIKTNVSKGIFSELDFPVTKQEFMRVNDEEEHSYISKDRFTFIHEKYPDIKFEVDNFRNDFKLILMEVEFPDEKTMNSFIIPEDLKKYIIKEVTGEPEYSNYNLALCHYLL